MTATLKPYPTTAVTGQIDVRTGKPYPAYKPSGVPWLPQVPHRWQFKRIKFLFKEKDQRTGTDRGVLLSLTRHRGLLPQHEASKRISSVEDLSNYRVCRSGDLVMNRMQAWSGVFAVSSYDGVVSPEYSVFEASVPLEVRFFESLFRTPALVTQFSLRSKGIGSGFNRLYTDAFSDVPVPVPPLLEQRAIVRFLDHADRRIQRYIRAKQKLITLLKEQKQAIINQAVTGQIDVRTGKPYPAYKPSGVPWLPQVPHRWQFKRIKFLFKEKDQRTGTDRGVLLSLTRHRGLLPQHEASKRISSVEDLSNYRVCRPGDLVMNRMQAWSGVFAVSSYDGVVSPEYSVFEASVPLEVRFFESLFRTPALVTQFSLRSKGIGSGFNRLYTDAFSDVPVPVPPLPEQRAIANFLDRVAAKTDAAIARAQREINLLREYRTRLIADVVTGKLDVREAAAALPEADPLAADDEAEELLQTSEDPESGSEKKSAEFTS